MGSSLHRGPVGELGGDLFFLDPEDIKSYVWGPSGTLARNRAPLS